MKLTTSNPFLSTTAALAALFAAPLAHAVDGTWNGITGNWTDTTNPGGVWSGGAIADGADFTAFFTGADIAADRIITLNGNRTIGNITFTDATTSSNNLTITGNTLTLDRTSGVPSIDVTQADRQLTIESIIAGNDGLQKIGAGTLTLKGTNTFTGGLTIKAGTVTSNGAGGGGNFLSSGTVTIGDSANTGAAATLNFNGSNFTSTNAISVVGTGTSSISVTGWSQILNGAITLSNNLSVITNNAFGSSLTFGGGMTGTGNLVIQSNAAMSGGNASKILFQTGALNMLGSITNSGTGSTGTPGNIDSTISSVIGTNVTGVTQNSANSALILSGANTFTGNITISAGTLNANLKQTVNNPTSGALGNPSTAGRQVTIASGGTLNFSQIDVLGQGGTGNTLLTLIANGGTIRNNIEGVNTLGPVQLNGGTLTSTATTVGNGFRLTGTVTVGGSAVSTISASTGTGTIVSSGVITYDVADAVVGSDLNVTAVVGALYGNGGIIKTGVGTMTLSNANTYTGGTRIDNGTLTLGHATNTLSSTGAVNVNGGTLALGTNSDTVGAVTLTSGSITGTSGVLTGSSYAVQSGSVSAILGGAGVGLTKTTGGTVTLTGVNTYSGATNINAGTLAVNGAGSINNSAVTVNGGTFRYNSSVAYTGTLTYTSGTIGGTNLTGTLGGQTIGSNQTISPGNSPGTLNTTSQTWAGGGSYLWEINNAAGIAGADPGWDLENGSGALTISATSGSQFNLLLTSLSLANVAGLATNFNSASNYNWLIADFASVTGFTANAFNINISSFQNAFTGNFGVALGGGAMPGDNSQIYLTYTAVPEPNVAALFGSLGALALLRRRRS